MDRPEQEALFRSWKQQKTAGTRYVGILNIQEESELARLDALGLDGVLHRPVSEIRSRRHRPAPPPKQPN